MHRFSLLYRNLYTYLSHLSDPENYAASSTDVTMHMEIVFRGAYAYYLQHYLKWFNRDQILILNANLLKTNPAKLLIETQGKLNDNIHVGDGCWRRTKNFTNIVSA